MAVSKMESSLGKVGGQNAASAVEEQLSRSHSAQEVTFPNS